MKRKDVLQAFYADPARAELRRQRGKDLLSGERGDAVRQRSTAVRRGVHVPPELEKEWRELRRKRLSAAEAAAALGLTISRELEAKRAKTRKRRKKRTKPSD